MRNIKNWMFDKTTLVANITFDHILQDFYSLGVSGLVRENIQNSLGAKVSDDIPVKVTINTGNHRKESIPGFEYLESRIHNLKPGNEYTKRIIDNMMSNIDSEIYNYISFEDENTKGLEHNLNGSDVFSSRYASYAYGQGSHYEDSEDKKRAKGGSHGIGKIASNSASIFNVMYFANCDANNKQTLGGTVELIEHAIDNQPYRGKGYFTDTNKDNNYIPIENSRFHKIFQKNTRGLKVIVPFVYDHFIDEEEIIRTVCDTFFHAIIHGSLEVEVNGLEITKETINEFVYNTKYFELDIEQIKDHFTPLYMKTLGSLYLEDFKIPSNEKMYSFTLMLAKDERIKKGRTAIIRRIGMKIEDHGVKGLFRSPYNAVLICNSEKEDEFLVTLENVSHTELSHNKLTAEKDKENAKRFLSQLDTKLSEVISDLLKDSEDASLDIDTEDILNYNDNKFEEDLHKRMSVVNFGSGINNPKGVKIDDTEEKGKSKRIKKGEKRGNKVKRVKKKFGHSGYKYYYQIKNSAIHRAINSKKERIEIDLSNENIFDQLDQFNILFTIVDGRGVEHYDIVDLNTLYKKIEDNNSYKSLECESYMVKSVSIKDGKIKLSLYLNDYNMNNKYRLYLEE